MTEFEKIVIISQKTWLDGLIEKYNTKEQAKFYIEHMGGSFNSYLISHNNYYNALKLVKKAIPSNIKYHVVDRSFLPNYLFGPNDLILVLGRDGLVINTAKYLDSQPIIGINPDPARIEGILVPFDVNQLTKQLQKVMKGENEIIKVTLSQAELNTNQSIVGVNDIFIGHKSHQSARYVIKHNSREEKHSSSGIIVSTGVGSTGWFKSIITGAMEIANQFRSLGLSPVEVEEYRVPWNADFLYFCVREPWSSKNSDSSIVFGQISTDEKLIIESNMPEGGVIFSDGIESDYVSFNSGTIAKIGIAKRRVNLGAVSK
ncbi:MAG: sugar kinase [Candidatus Kariarchaeaceae archaeon]|jgi:NAD kinase